MVKTFTSAITAAVLTVCVGVSASASPTDHLTKFTFNAPIAIPGVTLPAGTYIFKLADPSTDRKIVQVLDADTMQSYAMLQAVPRYRNESTDAAALTLVNTVKGMPAAVEAWWPFGESTGFEFLYPEEQYAKLTGGFGPSTINGEGLPSLVSSNVAQVQRRQASARSVSVTQEPASVLPAPAASENSAPFSPTAMPAVLVLLLGGLMLLGGGFALRKTRV